MLMEEAIDKKHFKGIDLDSSGLQILHLQYADNTIFFGHWNQLNISTLFHIIHCFWLISGLKLNLLKTRLFGVGVSKAEVKRMLVSFGAFSSIILTCQLVRK